MKAARCVVLLVLAFALCAETTVEQPFLGVTLITRTEKQPRQVTMRIVQIDLNAPGIRFALTAGGGSRETVRRTTLEFLEEEHAQLAVNAHFFVPFPSPEPDADLVGFAASNGRVISAFEAAPQQSYALLGDAPALHLDAANHASIVRRGTEEAVVWTAVSGSAQIITEGVKTIPQYKDAGHPEGELTPGGRRKYSNANSWYEERTARTVIGLSADRQTLYLFVVDRAGGSLGMSLGEVADLLLGDYDVRNALNLDGGGSTTLAMEDPSTHSGTIVNVSSDNPNGRSVASSLAVFAIPVPSGGAVRLR